MTYLSSGGCARRLQRSSRPTASTSQLHTRSHDLLVFTLHYYGAVNELYYGISTALRHYGCVTERSYCRRYISLQVLAQYSVLDALVQDLSTLTLYPDTVGVLRYYIMLSLYFVTIRCCYCTYYYMLL